MLTEKEQELLSALISHKANEELEIVTVEVVGAKKSPTIRVYIDTLDGVSFDDLAEAQSWMSALLDEIDPFPGAYVLEVSSPGIDRPLCTREHFERFIGERAVVTTLQPRGGRRSWTGIIVEADDTGVTLDVEGNAEIFSFDEIKKSHLKSSQDLFSSAKKDRYVL